jgi:hypothetical protein
MRCGGRNLLSQRGQRASIGPIEVLASAIVTPGAALPPTGGKARPAICFWQPFMAGLAGLAGFWKNVYGPFKAQILPLNQAALYNAALVLAENAFSWLTNAKKVQVCVDF